ncbi:brassinosteroid-6-oxidase 1 [Actinidia rufa]|uniref:Brassinosteroid-6-oxidase 1 n=1 Tax=Actinidia rufa TaxID=165716 RepID=A0A7J0G2K3_9ERIC|nr:brassinosteroid-6-oxidase 1 [Actinidia rufa]
MEERLASRDGWPVFGETTEFLKQGPDFMKNKRARFGSVFKSHILGSPAIVSMDPELNRCNLSICARGPCAQLYGQIGAIWAEWVSFQRGVTLQKGYPQSTLDILGKSNIAAVRGSDHKRILGSFLSLVHPSMLKDRLLPRMDKCMRLHLNNLNSKTIDIQKLTANMALFITFKQIMEIESNSSYEAFKTEFDKLMVGSLSLPINIPGTNYYRGFMDCKFGPPVGLLPRLGLGPIGKCPSPGLAHGPEMCIFGLGGVLGRSSGFNPGPIPIRYIWPGLFWLGLDGWALVRLGKQGRKRVLRILREIIEKRSNSLMKHDDILDYLLKNEDSRYKLNDKEILDQVIMILYSGFETMSTTSMMAIKYLHDHPAALQELRDEHFVIRKRKKPEEPIKWNDYKSMSFTRAVLFETSRLATIVNGVLRKTTEEMELNGQEHGISQLLLPIWRGKQALPGKGVGRSYNFYISSVLRSQYRWEEVGGETILKFPRVEAPNGLHVRVSKYQD